MGGKQKQAQRVKNNARPSNSGRSAELLGTTLPSFSLVTGMKETGLVAAPFTLTPIEDIDASVDPNFQLVLKKMNKKDATTKLKALQEFGELVKKTEAEAVKAILPFWPRLYCILATDADHRVREATHIAHGHVVTKAKRNLAPYLKQLAGPWFTSQYDTYAPASTAASKAFKAAFPINKLQDAIIFVQEEILNYISDNLIVHTAQTLSNPQIMSADECKAKYERVLISSLQGYTLYIKQVPEEAVRKVEHLHRKIISSPKFWKLARNDVALIRAAWFGVLASLCDKAKFLLDGEVPNVVKAVFANLNETDPTVQVNLWEAVLLTSKTIDEWWKYYNIEEKLLPKLWKVLREAGNGNAVIIYPNLLPLISHLPSTLNHEQFLPNFFNNMEAGLQQSSVRTSQSEARAVAVAFIECLKYSIMKNHNSSDLCMQLIKQNLMKLLDTSLIDSKASHKTLFNQIASLVQYWHTNKEEVSSYQQFLATFWKECENLFSMRLSEYASNQPEKVACELCARQIDFMIALKHTVKLKKQLKVQFSTATEEEDEDIRKGSERRGPRCSSNITQSYLDSLHRLVYNSCVLYIKLVDYDASKKLPKMIANVVSVVQEFESIEFVQYLKKEFCGREDADSVLLFSNVFNWIKSKELCERSVVDLFFSLLKYANDDETMQILDQIIQISNDTALGWCISSALSHPHNSRKIVQKWLGNQVIGEFLVKIVQYEINDNSTSDLSLLLKQIFTETNDGDLLIARESVDEILVRLSNCLENVDSYKMTIDNCASLAAYVASSIYTDNELQPKYADTLFLALFKFTCNVKDNDECEYISKDTIWEVKTAWQDALTAIASKATKEELFEMSENCASLFEKRILEAQTNDNDDSLTDIVTKYLLAIHKRKPLLVDDIAKLFFERELILSWKSSISSLSQFVNYFEGALCFPKFVDLNPSVPEINDNDILKYFTWKVLFADTLFTAINNEEENDEEDCDVNPQMTNMLKLFSSVELILLELLQDIVLFDKIVKHYNQLKYYGILEELNTKYFDVFSNLLKSLEPSIRTQFEVELNRKVAVDSSTWALAARKYYVDFCHRPVQKVYAFLSKDVQYPGRMHLTQVFAAESELSYDDIDTRISGLEGLVALRSLLRSKDDELDVQIAQVFSYIEKLRNEEMAAKFYNIDFKNWQHVQIIIEIIRLFTTIVDRHMIIKLSRRHWDFIAISLGSWSAKLLHAKKLFKQPQVATFMVAICKLYVSIKCEIEKARRMNQGDTSLLEEYTESSAETDDMKRLLKQCSDYIDEWENVFVKSITSDLVQMWLYLSEQYSELKTIPLKEHLFLLEIGRVISHFQPKYVFDCRIEGMPKWSKLLKQCCALLTHPAHALQLWSHHMLMVLSSGLIQVDQIAVDTNTPHEKGLIFEQFKDLLDETHNIVSTMLLDFKLGEDSCRVEPFTDSYTYTFAYLLLWDILLYLCEKSSTELRYQYSDWLKKEDLLNSLLSSIFKLMPLEVFHEKFSDSVHKWFTDKSRILSFETPITSQKIEHLCCAVYTSTVAQLPATVRQWWSNAEPKISQLVERVTSTYISRHLCDIELFEVSNHENKFRNMVIKVRQLAREVVAVYTVDDAQMELVITLPVNYPLGGPDVQCNRQIGGLPHKQWLMQLRMCVLHQNGRIWDALSLWNNNLDKKFDGVEECYICFGVLHPGTYQLPKLSCKTCRKKFHAACLYKWFSTSNKSACPICRNLF